MCGVQPNTLTIVILHDCVTNTHDDSHTTTHEVRFLTTVASST